MQIETAIRAKIQSAFSPLYVEVENESASHHRNPDGETHFRILVVSPAFEGMDRVSRQRQIQDLFAAERTLGLHALTMRTLTPTEWEQTKDQERVASPTCRN